MLALQVNPVAETIAFQKNIFQFSYINVRFFGGRFYNAVQEIWLFNIPSKNCLGQNPAISTKKAEGILQWSPTNFLYSLGLLPCPHFPKLRILMTGIRIMALGNTLKLQESRFVTYLLLHRSRCPAAAENEVQNLRFLARNQFSQ